MARVPTSEMHLVCGHCVWGDHYLCKWDRCACSRQDHDPGDTVAMTMAVVVRPDRSVEFRKDPQRAAAIWRNTFNGSHGRTEPTEAEMTRRTQRLADALSIPAEHRNVMIRTGNFNKRDPKDWCYLIHCPCGNWDDIAWSYEDAQESRDEHWREVQAATPPPKPKRQAEPKAKKPRRLVY